MNAAQIGRPSERNPVHMNQPLTNEQEGLAHLIIGMLRGTSRDSMNQAQINCCDLMVAKGLACWEDNIFTSNCALEGIDP